MTGNVAFVGSPGGHIDEAFEIAGRFARHGERFWITAKTYQTETLLAGEDVAWVPEVKSREGHRALRSLALAWRIMRSRQPRLVVSTGSALTVPYMVAARARRVPVTYVESATRMSAPSLTGQIAEKVPGIATFYQGEGWSRPGWSPCGSVFDGYAMRASPDSTVSTVLITVGSEKYPFPRAIDAVKCAIDGIDTAWQTGHTEVGGMDLPGEVRAWWPGDELALRARSADVVITHAGVGSILMALRAGSCPVVIPRLRALGEHVDDHQIELAQLLASRGVVVVAMPGDDMSARLAEAGERRIVKVETA